MPEWLFLIGMDVGYVFVNRFFTKPTITIMETVQTISIKKEDMGIDYAIITLIIAYVLGTIVQAVFTLSASVL